MNWQRIQFINAGWCDWRPPKLSGSLSNERLCLLNNMLLHCTKMKGEMSYVAWTSHGKDSTGTIHALTIPSLIQLWESNELICHRKQSADTSNWLLIKKKDVLKLASADPSHFRSDPDPDPISEGKPDSGPT